MEDEWIRIEVEENEGNQTIKWKREKIKKEDANIWPEFDVNSDIPSESLQEHANWDIDGGRIEVKYIPVKLT